MAPSTFLRSPLGPGLLAALVLLSAGEGGAAAVDPDGNLDHIRPLLQQTLETEKSGVEIRWSNPATGHIGRIRVERTFFRDERPCRDYVRTVSRPGASGFVIRGTACRTGRAVWTIEDEVAVERDRPRPEPARATAPAAPEGAPTETAPERARAEAAAAPPAAEAAAPEGAAPTPDAARSDPQAAEPEPEPFVTFTMPSRSPI